MGAEGGFALSGRDQIELMRRAASADIFLTGINAITLDGKLINIDGFGNRVAGLIFGPRKVIVLCGANKIVPDVDAGLRRVKMVAAPMNASYCLVLSPVSAATAATPVASATSP